VGEGGPNWGKFDSTGAEVDGAIADIIVLGLSHKQRTYGC